MYSLHDEFDMWIGRLNNRQRYFVRFQKVIKICYGYIYCDILKKIKKGENFEVLERLKLLKFILCQDFVG